MARLPDEIWVQIFDYLDPSDLLATQLSSKQLLKIARDPSLWKGKCFEKAPSAAHAFSNGDSLSDSLNGLSLTPSTLNPSRSVNAVSTVGRGRRARAIARWDCTDGKERTDWYSEYISRNAPLSIDWTLPTHANEIRSMALFDDDKRVLSAMEDGSLRIWDVKVSRNGCRSLQRSEVSVPELLFTDLSLTSSSSRTLKSRAIGTAIDSTVVHHSGHKAYIAVEDTLNEIDLDTLSIVSQQKWAWRITAISQQSDWNTPLMVGTSFSLNMHDPRTPLQYQAQNGDDRLHLDDNTDNTVFLPNYAKGWRMNSPVSPKSRRSILQDVLGHNPGGMESMMRRRASPEVFAPVEPGPQTVLHYRTNEVIVAGRMPSILFYDKRNFPQLQSVIHSGARLSSLAVIPYRPPGATSSTAEATLVAAGEYHGRGSLEVYELPHHRPSDPVASYDESEEQSSLASAPQRPETDLPSTDAPYSYRNRQSSSSSKLLSVATQGSRIVFSDGDGGLKWVERNARGLARRWNINSYQYNHAGGALIGESVARKILTFASDAQHNSGKLAGMSRGDGDLLLWTGAEMGIVTSKVRWTGHDELVAAFEEKLSLEDSPEGGASRSIEDIKKQEEEYAKIMRRALERQADERRFLARFGRMGGW